MTKTTYREKVAFGLVVLYRMVLACFNDRTGVSRMVTGVVAESSCCKHKIEREN